MVITDRNFSSVTPSRQFTAGLVPEWELIGSDLTRKCMSQLCQSQHGSVYAFQQVKPLIVSQTPLAHFSTRVITRSFHFFHCVNVVKYFTNERWEGSFLPASRCSSGVIFSMPPIFQYWDCFSFSKTPTAVEWSKVCKGKMKYCCLWSCFKGKNIAVGSAMTQAGRYIGTFAPHQALVPLILFHRPLRLDEVGTMQTHCRFRLRGWQREHIILYNGKQQQKQSSYWQTQTKQIFVENNKHWNPPGLSKQDVFVPLFWLPLSEWVRSVNEWVGD